MAHGTDLVPEHIRKRQNAWLDEKEKPRATVASRPGPRAMSAVVQRLAAKLGKSADELAARFGEDTVKRTRYPVIEEHQEDGTVLFKHSRVGPDGARQASVRK